MTGECGDEVIDSVMVAGEAFEVEFQVLVNDVPEDITGYTAKIDLKKSGRKGNLIQSWDDSSAAITRVNADGKITLRIEPAETNGYDFDLAYMDLLLLKADAGRRSATLKVEFAGGVTR